ncbi:MAG: VOC family protein [bacterium]
MTTRDSSSDVLPRLQRLTPVMIVDAVEPCLEFWVSRLGFVAENQVPGDDGRLVFASAIHGDIEVMYQTRASVIAESPSQEADLTGHTIALFITTDNLDAAERALEGAPVVKPRHKTFYGSEEIYVKEPGGNTVGFSQFT